MSRSGIAGGDIYPCRFVTEDTVDGQFVAATASNSKICGVSFQDGRRSQYVDASGKLAASGEPFSFYTLAENCNVEMTSSAGCTGGNYLMATAGGLGIVATGDGAYYGAKARDTVLAGQFVPVQVVLGQQAS